VGSGAFAVSIALNDYTYGALALHAAVWFFLLPIFLGVSVRMVPFFASRVLGDHVSYRPAWARPALMAGTLGHGALELAGADAWLWLIDLPLGTLVAYLVWRWGLVKALHVRLLAVLHLSLAVLSVALLLYGTLSVALALGTISRIGLAPLHLIVIGFFAAMVLGMVTRVSLGHSGRPLHADRLTWACYLALLLAAALRVASEFAIGTAAGGPLTLASAGAWIAAFSAWGIRYVPMYLQPRVDAPQA
jgi:uncharacterized protein involved in response to NO